MNYLLFWLSVSAFTGVIARPVSYSSDFATYRDIEYDLTDAINWPTNTNVAQNAPLRYDPLIVATNPQGSKNVCWVITVYLLLRSVKHS